MVTCGVPGRLELWGNPSQPALCVPLAPWLTPWASGPCFAIARVLSSPRGSREAGPPHSASARPWLSWPSMQGTFGLLVFHSPRGAAPRPGTVPLWLFQKGYRVGGEGVGNLARLPSRRVCVWRLRPIHLPALPTPRIILKRNSSLWGTGPHNPTFSC